MASSLAASLILPPLHQQTDAQHKIQQLYSRLLYRSYTPEHLLLLFSNAHRHAMTYLSCCPEEREQLRQQITLSSKRYVLLHLPFHSNDPQVHTIQSLWKEHVSEPKKEPKLFEMTNYQNAPTPIEQLTIAYCRPSNLCNQFSIHTIGGRGHEVSSFL
jgi:hypothetical protein